MSQLLTAREVSEFLGISESALYRRRSLGMSLPPAVKFSPSTLRWRIEDVEQWIENNYESPTQTRKKYDE